jgi:hypothetical protein
MHEVTLMSHMLFLRQTPSDMQGSQVHAGAVAGVVPFAIGAYEFGKRIVSGCTTELLPAAVCSQPLEHTSCTVQPSNAEHYPVKFDRSR